MDIFSGIATFFMIWWTVIFCALPFWQKPARNTEDGIMPGAPEDPQLKRKFIWTTVISIILWLIIFAIVESGMISFREMVAHVNP